MLAFVDSSIERFNTGYGSPPQLYGNLDQGDNWSAGSPECYYNQAIRHPKNSTNALFLDGHVVPLFNSYYNNVLSLSPSFRAGISCYTKTMNRAADGALAATPRRQRQAGET